MHINYNLWGTFKTGGNRVILEFAKGLHNLGHTITITLLYSNKTELASFYNIQGIELIPIKRVRASRALNYLTKSVFSAKFGSTLNEIFSDYDIRLLTKNIPECDFNIATYYPTAFSTFYSNKGIPIYHIQHWEPLICYDEIDKRIAEASYYLPLQKIVNSSWLQQKFKEKLGLELPVITPGIDLQTFTNQPKRKENSHIRIVSYVTPAKNKGFQDLIDALLILKKRGLTNIELITYGSRKINPKVFVGLDKIKFVFYHDISDEMLAKLYSSADIVVFPSWYESSPLPPMEAMACGAAVITTRPGTEDFAFHEQNSLVVEPMNSQQIANQIQHLIQDEELAATIRKNAIATAHANFKWSDAVKKMNDFLKNINKNSR
ncbi:MAG: glycosyltransferase family 4 protein [Candidatus Helarchaeota archaeon]